MIKVVKNPVVPPSLAANELAWKTRLLALILAGDPVPKSLGNEYNQDDVKEALRIESKGKCMYCESKIAHVAPEHIEHIKPKAKDKFPELTFDWQNLGLACPQCNMNKGSNYDEALPFINPYIDDPKAHFVAAGPFMAPLPGDGRARLTDAIIDLNRGELFERRKDRLDKLQVLFHSYVTEPNQSLRAIMRIQIVEELGADREYSMCANAFSLLSRCP